MHHSRVEPRREDAWWREEQCKSCRSCGFLKSMWYFKTARGAKNYVRHCCLCKSFECLQLIHEKTLNRNYINTAQERKQRRTGELLKSRTVVVWQPHLTPAKKRESERERQKDRKTERQQDSMTKDRKAERKTDSKKERKERKQKEKQKGRKTERKRRKKQSIKKETHKERKEERKKERTMDTERERERNYSFDFTQARLEI